MKETVLKEFGKVFGDTDGVKVFFAPGRVNLIGEHTITEVMFFPVH